MTTIFKAFSGQPEQLGPRTIRVVCSDATLDFSGEVVVPDGIKTSAYMRNPVVLWSHCQDKPIGNMTALSLSAGKLVGTIEFYPEGVSQKSDEICALTKLGSIKGVSIGFDPIETAPMDPTKPRGPQRYIKSELFEVSVVALPCNPSAEVIQRARKMAGGEPRWTCGAAGDLPVQMDGDWDETAARNAIFDQFGFNHDRPDSAAAARAFLAYDASEPLLKASYRVPFCTVIGGRLTAMAAGLRAAPAALNRADLPDMVRTNAMRILAGYQAKMGDKSHIASMTKAQRIARAIALAPLVEHDGPGAPQSDIPRGSSHEDRLARKRRAEDLWTPDSNSEPPRDFNETHAQHMEKVALWRIRRTLDAQRERHPTKEQRMATAAYLAEPR
jgi:HK97 family phage prohead protease